MDQQFTSVFEKFGSSLRPFPPLCMTYDPLSYKHFLSVLTLLFHQYLAPTISSWNNTENSTARSWQWVYNEISLHADMCFRKADIQHRHRSDFCPFLWTQVKVKLEDSLISEQFSNTGARFLSHHSMLRSESLNTSRHTSIDSTRRRDDVKTYLEA